MTGNEPYFFYLCAGVSIIVLILFIGTSETLEKLDKIVELLRRGKK